MRKSIIILVWAVLALVYAPSVAAQGTPFRTSRATFLTSTGQPLSGGCIFTYAGGTTTPQATYTDYTIGTPNSNPVILDSSGSAVIWLGSGTYKYVAYSYGGTNCASGSLQWSVDQIPGNAFLGGTISGSTISNPTITGGTQSGTALSGVTVASSNINSTAIGQTTPASGSFTSLTTPVQNVSFSSTPVFSAASYGYFLMTLTGAVTSSTLTGGATGQYVTFQICQNGTGGYAFAWPANLNNPPPINTIAYACTTDTAFYNGATWTTVYSSTNLLVGNYNTLTFSATPVFAASSYTNFTMVLTGNVSSSTITGGVAGQIITLDLCQDATGARTFAWPTNLLYPPTLIPTASTCTALIAVYNGTNWVTNFTNVPPWVGSVNVTTSTPTFTFAAGTYNFFFLTLGGNITSSTLTGGVNGQIIAIVLCQDSTGSHTMAWPSNFYNPPTLVSTAGACTGTTAMYVVSNWFALGSAH